MKKLLVITIAAASLVAMQARADLQINFVGGLFYDNGNAVVSSAVGAATGLILEDQGGLGVPTLTLTAGQVDTVGTLIGGNWLVIGSADFSSLATDGYDAMGTGSLLLGSLGSGTIAAGKAIDFMWIPGSTPGVLSGGYYGSITETTDLSGGDAWVVPPDGSIYSPALYTLASTAGDIPDANTIANNLIVPEPSSMALVVVGLLGAIGLIRRRR
jgi:hypothetical protein